MTPAEAREALDTARSEAAEAHATVEALAERVRDGDEHVTPEELAGQRSLAELAGLRVEAAERKLAAAEAADRDARAKAIAAAARQLIETDDTQPVLDAVQAAVAALKHLVTVTTDRTARILTVATEAVGMNEELKLTDPDAGPWPSTRYGFRAQTFPAHVAVLDEGNAAALRPGRMVAAALALALADDQPMVEEARQVLSAPFAAVIERLKTEVPGLDEALRQPAQG
ncbi:hypothetical protein [Streptomyces sp. NPDC090021]|uniref:hypothetical protein n=1 Tax=Streptomyces sp. NPDC090021 TaxID=3365919 RepID=UPI0038033941